MPKTKKTKKTKNVKRVDVYVEPVVEIPKPLEDYIQGGQDTAVQYGFDIEAARLTRELIGNQKPETGLRNSVAKRVAELAEDLVRLSTLTNYRGIGVAYQIGVLLIVMKDRLRTIENNRASTSKYKKWLEALINAYVRGKLNIAAETKTETFDTEVASKYWKLYNSKQRQLQKYVNLAQCGDAILKYGYGGIDGALEVRWLILDIEELSNPGIKPKITIEMARIRLASFETRFPFPTPDELAGKQMVKEMRSHVDALCTYFRIVNSGVSEDVVTFTMAKEFAETTKMSLEKDRAELAPEVIKDIPEGQKTQALDKWLRTEAERAKNISSEGIPEITSQMVMDYLSKIEQWKRKAKIVPTTYQQMASEQAVKLTIDAVREVVISLHDAVHADQSGRVA